MIHSRVNVLFILWQLLQTPALGASANLLRNCLLLTTSKEHSVEVHVGGKAPDIVLPTTLDCPVSAFLF